MINLEELKRADAEERRAARASLPVLAGAVYADHDRLDHLLDELVVAARGDDRDAIAATWRDVELALRAHMAVEETEVLPRLALARPEAAVRLCSDHDDIRSSLEEIGLAVDLHAVRAHAVEELVRMLRVHADWEQKSFYPFAAAR